MRLVVQVKIGHSEQFTDGEYDALGNYGGGITRDVQAIQWAPTEDDRRWRLMYVVFRRFGNVDIIERIAIAGPTFGDKTEELDRKPLIETPVAIRLQAHKYLANLVEEIGKLVEFSPIARPESPSDDIPF